MLWLAKLMQMTDQESERYLPTAFNSGLTLLEKINQVIEYLNNTIVAVNTIGEYVDENVNAQNQKIKDLRDEFEALKYWLENEGLSERVVIVLNEWFDNGKLAEIINNEVFDMKANQTEVDDIQKKILVNASKKFFMGDYPRLAVEVDDSPRIQRCLDEAGSHGFIEFEKDTVYTIGSLPVTPKQYQYWDAEGTTFVGNLVNIGILFKGTAVSSNSRVTIKGLQLMDFDVAVKMENHTESNNGCYYNVFDDVVILNSLIGFDLGINSNANRFISPIIQNTGKAFMIRSKAYANQITSPTIESPSRAGSIGIVDEGAFTTVTGGYYEKLDVGIDGSKGTGSYTNPYMQSVTTDIIEGLYNNSFGRNRTNFHSHMKMGRVKFEHDLNTLFLSSFANSVTKMEIPFETKIKNNKFTIEGLAPEVKLVSTSTQGKDYTLRNYLGELLVLNHSGATVGKFTETGFVSTGGSPLPRYTTENRPNPPKTDAPIIDITLRKIIWYSGNSWYDSMGNPV